VKVDKNVLDAASVITKLRRALKDARARARSWRKVAKHQQFVYESAYDILREVQKQRDQLLRRCDHLDRALDTMQAMFDQANGRAIQYHNMYNSLVASQQSPLAQLSNPLAQLSNPPGLQYDQQQLAQAQQNQQQLHQYQQLAQAQPNQQHDVYWRGQLDWCNCVPARQDVLLGQCRPNDGF
jgi:gamma-glutamylcysteine synthetase